MSAWSPQIRLTINYFDGLFEEPQEPRFNLKRNEFIIGEWDRGTKVWERVIHKQNVRSIDHDRDAGEVVVYVDNGDVWYFKFENTKEARAAVAYLMI